MAAMDPITATVHGRELPGGGLPPVDGRLVIVTGVAVGAGEGVGVATVGVGVRVGGIAVGTAVGVGGTGVAVGVAGTAVGVGTFS